MEEACLYANHPGISTDKLTDQYVIRIPEITKRGLEQLSPVLKKKLNQQILLDMARIIHESKFDPSVYLTSE